MPPHSHVWSVNDRVCKLRSKNKTSFRFVTTNIPFLGSLPFFSIFTPLALFFFLQLFRDGPFRKAVLHLVVFVTWVTEMAEGRRNDASA